MKFYKLTLLFLLFISQFALAQNSTIDNNKSELPIIKKESLQLSMDVELYPNPSVDFLNITLKNANLKNVEFEMYNVIGNKIDFEYDAVNGVSYKINVKEFNPGYYLLIIKDPMSRFNKAFKFRKQ
jgi:hypothetical protein